MEKQVFKEKYDFVVIYSKTKKNKKIYLQADKGESCKWTFLKNEAIWFETEQQAEQFGNHYFKNFKNWNLESFTYSI